MKKKLRVIIDEDIASIKENSRFVKSINFITIKELDLPIKTSDKVLLSAGQRKERLIVTGDKGSGFSQSTVHSPNFNKTGAIIVRTQRRDMANTVIKLSQAVSHEDLVQARTEVSQSKACISRINKKIIIKFKP